MQSYKLAGVGRRRQWLAGLCILFWLSAVLMGQSRGTHAASLQINITSQQAKELLAQLQHRQKLQYPDSGCADCNQRC